MKIIILGAGQVGTTLAEHLATDHNDITIIDLDAERLRTLQERMDILTITGHGAYPNTLRRGGAEDADMLIAVTSSDETNLVACQVAHTLFQTPTKIARVRSLQYLAHEKLFGKSTGFPVDVLISPEQLVTNSIRRLIEYPNALQVLDFANQKIQLISLKAKLNRGSMIGKPLSLLPQHISYVDARIVAIFRQGIPIIPTASTLVAPEDEIFFITANQHVHDVLGVFTHLDPPNKRIIIAGGGNIGTRLADSLDNEFQVKVIEINPDRVEMLATQLSRGIVLKGDAADKELLLGENIEETDVFCAVTDKDETNIMSAILAKRLGARKVMALISRPSYLDVVEGGEIDIAISPQQATIGSLLTHVRQGQVVNVHSLRRGTAEAIEISIRGNKSTSKVIGRAVKDIPIPDTAIIGAIIRGPKVMIGHDDIILEANDHVIVFLVDTSKVRQVERLFQEEGGL
jgi:trk system potassium uptake protein TrkA